MSIYVFTTAGHLSYPKPHESIPRPSILLLDDICISNWNFNVQVTTENREIGIVAASSVCVSDILI